jgi:hypothetical protein
MPHRVEVTIMPGQPSQIAFDVDVASYAINRPSGDSTELWAMPQIEGYPSVDIADPQFRLPVAAIPPDAASPVIPYTGYAVGPGAYGAHRTAAMPDFRGYERPWR